MLVASDGSQYHWKQVTTWGTTTLRVSALLHIRDQGA